MTARRIFVRGHVQGVFYRGWCVTTARVLGLSGWVRNRADGSVEILAWGNEQAVSALIEHCREGPPAAIVESVEVSEADAEPSVGFEARASG